MTIKSVSRNDVNSIRRSLHRNPDIAVLGQSADANSAVSVNDRPGYWWVREIQAGGTFGPAVQVRGCTIPMATTPGTPVKMGIVEGEKTVLGPDFVGILSQGGNPTQAAVVDPNANNAAFVNQAFIATAFEQIVEGTLLVALRGAIPLAAGVFVKVEGQFDFTGNVPSSGQHCVATTAIQSDLVTTETQYSTPKDTQIPLDIDDLNEAWALMSDPTTNKPLWSWDIGNGQTALVEANRWMDNRQFLNWESSGGGSGNVTGISPTVVADFAMWDDITGTTINDTGLSLSTDGTFASNSDSLIPSQKAAKTYTDNAVQNAINGLAPKADLALWTNAALPTVVYANGSSGVGATLTGVSTGVLTIDGVAVTAGMRIGVKDQVSQLQNGLFSVTTAGAIGVAFVLTRTTDANTSAELIGAYAFALQGTVNADTAYLCSNSSAITIGTTAITFVKFQGAGINQLTGDVTAGPGTGSQAATLATVNSNVGTFTGPLAITANAKGLITAIATATINLATQVAGLLGLANGGTGVDLSASGSATNILAQDASHVISARNLVAGDIPNLPASIITSGALALARGGTNADLSASGSSTAVLAQDASHVVSARSLIAADIPNLAASKITSGQLALAQGGTNADLSATGPGVLQQATSGAAVTVTQVNRSQTSTGMLFADVCSVGSNISISSPGIASLDGIGLNSGLTIMFLRSQSTASQNGPWLFNGLSSPLTRPTWFASGSTTQAFYGQLCYIIQGTVNAGRIWFQNTTGAITIDTTAQSWPLGQISVSSVNGIMAAANVGTMTGDSGSGGASGAVPAPATGDAVHGFFGDGTYAGAARKLVDLTVLGASAASIDLTSLPTTYKMLCIELELRSDRGATTDNAYIRFNNDSTIANYDSYSIQENGTTPTATALERLGATASGIECNLVLGDSAPAGDFTYMKIWLYNYANTAVNRKADVFFMSRSGTTTGNLRQSRTNGWWLNTANAISRVTILPVTGSNWKANSSYMVYGYS